MNDSLKQNFLFIKWFFVFILFETVFLLISYNYDFFGYKALINYLLVLLISPIIYEKTAKGKVDIFSPIVIVIFFYFVIFVLVSSDLLFFRSDELRSDEKFYTYTVFYAIISFHAFILGYYSNLSKIFLKLRVNKFKNVSNKRVVIVTCLYSLISFLSFFLIIKASGGFSYYVENIKGSMVNLITGSAFLYMGVILIKIPLLIGLFIILKKGKLPFSYILFFLFSSILLILLGERGHFVFLIISMLVIYHYTKKRLRLIPASMFALLLYLFLVMYGQYREFGFQKQNKIDAKKNYKLGLAFTYKKVVENFDQLIRVKDIVKYVPEKLEYQYGKTFFNLLLKPIPSRIWPEKPQGAGYYVTKSLYPKHFAANASIATSLLGELYLNFHIIGIVFGMFVFGFVVSGLYKFLVLNSPNFYAVILYSLCFPYFFSELRGDFAVVTSFWIFELIFLIIALNYVSKKEKNRI